VNEEKTSADSAWALSIDLPSAKALVWVASVGGMIRAMRRLASLLMLCVMLGATTVAAGPGSRSALRVFVYTAEAKDAVKAEEEQGRLDSVRDVREALSHNSRIVLVSDASAAQVLVDVTGREKREAPVGGFGGTVVTPLVETIVRLHVKFGDHETEIKGVGKAYWARAAKDAADRLVKWIMRNAATPGPGRSTSQDASSAF
jgi:hypothetical protein